MAASFSSFIAVPTGTRAALKVWQSCFMAHQPDRHYRKLWRARGMKTIKPESIALFCLLSGDVDLAKHLAEILPISCFVGEDWQQDFQPLDGGPVQSLSDAYSDYSVLLLIAAESEISVPEWLAHSEGTTVIVIAEHNARLLTGPAGGAVALIHYLNEICHSRETAVNDAFCRTLTRGSLAIPQCHLLS